MDLFLELLDERLVDMVDNVRPSLGVARETTRGWSAAPGAQAPMG
jgi:hypothetical protein